MTATDQQQVEIPDSPVGSRIRWFLDCLHPDKQVTAEEVKEGFAESFLAQAPPQAIADTMNGGSLGKVSPARIQSPSEFAAVVDMVPDGEGFKFRLQLMVEQEEPFRIAVFGVEGIMDAAPGAEPRPWEEVAGGEPVREERAGANQVDAALTDELEEMIDDAREEAHYVGLAVGIGGPDGLVWFRGFGPATREGAPVRPDTVFRIGSVSKTMTAIGVMQLVEAGRFDLDDPVNDVLRSYRVNPPEGGPAITVRHLLTHMSGLDPRPVDIGCKFGEPVTPLGEYYKDGLDAKRPAGESWAYSNDAFATLGHIVEEQTGQPFAEAMRENLFRPLGMSSSSFLRDPELVDRLVTGWNPEGDDVIETLDRDIIVLGAGSVYSTAEDMARYTACLMGGGAPVLKTETLERMWEPQEATLEGIQGHMGLAFIVHDIGGNRVAWHNGGWPGAATSMWVAPESGRSVTLTANTFGAKQSGALDQLGKAIVSRLLGVPST